MKRPILLTLSFILAAMASASQAQHSAVEPAPRGDKWWQDRHESMNKKVAAEGEKAQVIFIGDSITQGWEGEGKAIWAERYADMRAINLGIGGDRTQHVLWRLDNGNLNGLNPKAAVVMIGTNNSNGEDNTAEQIADGVSAIVARLRSMVPHTKILLVPIFPRGENINPQRGKINQVNQIIQKLADGEYVIWTDFGHKFIDNSGRIPKALMPDFLHLSPAGYQIWADSIDPSLRAILGEKQAPADLSGDWIIRMPGPNDEPIEFGFSLKQNGGTLEGTFERGEGRTLKIEEGKVEGQEFAWVIRRDRPSGDTMVYRMSGRLEDGKLVGKTNAKFEGNEVSNEWTGRRK